MVIMLLLVLLSIELFSQIPSDILNHVNFEIGEKYYVLKHEANLYREPTRNSEIIFTLNLNDEIEILEKTEIWENIDVTTEYWFKIKRQNNVGYAFGGNIALRTLITDIDRNGTNDFLHFRRATEVVYNIQSLAHSYSISFIDSYNDIFIYLNNQQLNTSVLNRYYRNNISDEHLFDWCEFKEESDHIKIILYNLGRDDYLWATVYKLMCDGTITFYEFLDIN